MGYDNCNLCGRLCGINRMDGELGVCNEGSSLRIASAGLHRGEEPPISGDNGSGTVFLSGCGLRCSFCQNHQISCGSMGREVTLQEAADIYLALQDAGAANVNFVTGTHFAPSVVDSISIARDQGLSIPVVWNSSGYDTPEAVDLIRDTVDIFLPDCKTLSSALARQYFHAPDYPAVAKLAIELMVNSHEIDIQWDELRRGTIVRHLVLPGHIDSTREVLEWFGGSVRDKAFLSLMVQFADPGHGGRVPHGTISTTEYDQVLAMLDEYDIENGFMQDLGKNDDWNPDFSVANPFPPTFYKSVWHWAD